MHARPPEVVFTSAHVQLMSWDDVFVMRWTSASDLASVRRMVEEHTRFVDARPERTTMALTHVDMENVSRPDDEMRRIFTEYDAAITNSRLRASAAIVAGGGFAGGVVRGILSGFALVSRRKTPQRVCSSAREALEFLQGHSAKSGGNVSLESLLATYERACRS